VTAAWTAGVAVAGWLLAAAFLVAGLLATLAAGTGVVEFVWTWGLAELVGAAGFCTMGAVLVARRPANAVGWLMFAAGFGPALAFFGARAAIAEQVGVDVGLVSAVAVVHGAVRFLELPWSPLLGLFLLVFPDGRFRSRPWQVAGGLLAAAGGAQLLAGWGVLPAGLWDVLDIVVMPLLLLAPVSLVLRYRSADEVGRQQLKLLTFAVVAVVVVFFAGAAAQVAPITNALTWPAVPAAVAVAVLRYRLFDIDRLISRTVSYTVVTGILALVYVGAVLVIGGVTASRGPASQVSVAAGTLIVAALFRPLRTRVPAGVDRRFNRSRYDAQRLVTAFSERLRDEIDLDDLRRHLLATVETTLQPTITAVVLRGPRA
jgi:hypothetical protein